MDLWDRNNSEAVGAWLNEVPAGKLRDVAVGMYTETLVNSQGPKVCEFNDSAAPSERKAWEGGKPRAEANGLCPGLSSASPSGRECHPLLFPYFRDVSFSM